MLADGCSQTQFGEDGVAKPLTYEALMEAFEQIKNLPEPCANGHVVRPHVVPQGRLDDLCQL